MKQLVILSGKGGTGKTTISSAFIKMSNVTAFADCDVDAPNLHLIFNDQEEISRSNYYAMPKAKINQNICRRCGKCISCKFDAISKNSDGSYVVNPIECEGCGYCQLICPFNAIEFNEWKAGETIVKKSDKKIFSTAKLLIGNGTSGKLVNQVKKNLLRYASDAEFSIVDGSPGIGCPVISTLSGANAVLIVIEPSISGFSDLKRIIDTANNFDVKVLVCINKFDINLEISKTIENFCLENNISFVGVIPYDDMAVKAINQGKSVVDINCKSGNAIKDIYNKVTEILKGV